MKPIRCSVLLVLIMGVCVLLPSCDKSCSGKGTLKLKNTSHNTVQRVMVDGVNYGTLDPNEEKEISIAAGEHEFQQIGISGGSGCSAAKVIIIECETSAFSCKN